MSTKILTGDTAVIAAYLYQDDGVTPQSADSVSWSILRPDQTYASVPATVSETWSVTATGGAGTLSGTYQYAYTWMINGYESGLSTPTTLTTSSHNGTVTFTNAAPTGVTARYVYRLLNPSTTWRRIGTLGPGAAQSLSNANPTDSSVAAEPPFVSGSSSALLVSNDTTQVGEYTAIASFSESNSGHTRSVLDFFNVIDPTSVSSTEEEKTIDLAWVMFSNLFDSELGGPWLRDASKINFDKAKMGELIELALYAVNQLQPTNTYSVTTFPYTTARPLLAKALEIETIKHLMRSYVEQPITTSSGSITYFERRDYLDRWNTILQIELAQYKQWLAMFKRAQYAFGTGKLLIDTKTRGFNTAAMRTRYPRGPIWGW